MKQKLFSVPAAIIALVCLAYALPGFLKPYHLDTMVRALIILITVASFRLLTTMGYWSFAQIGFMSIGAYTSALLAIHMDWPFWLTLPIGVLCSAVIGLLTSFPLFKLAGGQFFLASYAVGEAIRYAFILALGYQGTGLVPRPQLPGISFEGVINYYYLTLGFVLFSLLTMYWIEHSRIGNTIKCIAASGDLCKSLGINTNRYKAAIFSIVAAFAGLAGVLLAHYINGVTQDPFTVNASMNVVIFMMIGGQGSFAGPIIGSILMTFIRDPLVRALGQNVIMVYGALFIAVVLAMPGGIASLFRPRGRQAQRLKL